LRKTKDFLIFFTSHHFTNILGTNSTESFENIIKQRERRICGNGEEKVEQE
jgi:hypothetical protein